MRPAEVFPRKREGSHRVGISGEELAAGANSPRFHEELSGLQYIMRAFFAIGFPVLTFFVAYNLLARRYVEVVLVFSMAALLLWPYFALRKFRNQPLVAPEKQYRVYQNVIRGFLLIFLAYIAYATGWKAELDRVQWSYIFPVVAFLCLGRREGFCWVLLFLTSMVLILHYPHPAALSPDAFAGFKFRFLMSFSVMCAIGFAGKQGIEIIYARLVLRQDQLAESEDKYRKAYEGLHKEMEERQQAQQALAESEQRYRLHFENVRDVIYSLDTEFIVRTVSPSAERLMGARPEEIIGKHFTDLNILSPKYIEQAMSDTMRVFAGETIDSSLYEFTAKDGTLKVGDVSGAPLFQDGKVIGLVAVARDITERKRAEAEKLSLQMRLQQAQKMEAIGTLAGGVAHDLNNVLSGIVSYPDLLLMQLPKDSPLQKPLTTIRESGKKAAAIVQDLLTLARRGVSTSEVVNLNDVISEYLESPEHDSLITFHPLVHVQTDFDMDLLPVMGSPLHLSKAVMNLISNAAEAMPEGGKILVSTKNIYIDTPMGYSEHLEKGDYVTLSVSDTGTGISAEDRERIFEPFYTKKVMGRSGTGLGMAVIWGTVEDHNGYIDIRSAEGKGTAFTLYFPATRKVSVKGKPLLSMEQYRGKGESILVVDDAENQREIASAILSHLGYAVAAVPSGEAAIEYVKNGEVDLLILDMVMDPGIDGLETYLRILEIHPKQKAVITSGYSETARIKESQRLGAGAYIKKPYTLETLCVAVRKGLDR